MCRPGTVSRVAEFMNVPCSDELRDLVVERASIEYMQEKKSMFDESGEWRALRYAATMTCID